MMKMQYDAARDSQEGVAVKLIDELREQHLKEAALAYAVMLAQDAALREWQQRRDRRRGSSGSNGNGAAADGGAGDAPVVFSAGQIDGACEDFLLQRFGLKVCISRPAGMQSSLLLRAVAYNVSMPARQAALQWSAVNSCQ
jgi:hypothetical protein